MNGSLFSDLNIKNTVHVSWWPVRFFIFPFEYEKPFTSHSGLNGSLSSYLNIKRTVHLLWWPERFLIFSFGYKNTVYMLWWHERLFIFPFEYKKNRSRIRVVWTVPYFPIWIWKESLTFYGGLNSSLFSHLSIKRTVHMSWWHERFLIFPFEYTKNLSRVMVAWTIPYFPFWR